MAKNMHLQDLKNGLFGSRSDAWKGNIAQQIFWYTAFTAALTKPNTPVVNSDGTPKWRMAPSPHGAYWEKGMKLGYQDTGSWTFMKTLPENEEMPLGCMRSLRCLKQFL